MGREGEVVSLEDERNLLLPFPSQMSYLTMASSRNTGVIKMGCLLSKLCI
jgi:hypothetical protein